MPELIEGVNGHVWQVSGPAAFGRGAAYAVAARDDGGQSARTKAASRRTRAVRSGECIKDDQDGAN